ncbi:dihydrofolate reductase family protein [Angustibacter aerolatus]
MRRIVTTHWVSLDGFISGPDDDMSFVGRTFDERMGEYQGQIIEGRDVLLLGRRTYDSFAGAWPQRAVADDTAPEERAYAQRLGAMRKVVVSSTLTDPEWEHTEVWPELTRERVDALKAEDGGDVLVYGSGRLVSALTDLGAVDEYQTLLQPVVLGGGTRQLGGVDGRTDLELVRAETFPSGVVLLVHRPEAPAAD